MATNTLRNRADEIFTSRLFVIQKKTDHVFAVLLVLQWIFAIILAVTASPRTWVVDQPYWHVHLWAAIGLGGALTWVPTFLAITRKGTFSTRVVIAIAQVGYSTLLIHLTGGRIETHFHVFGSLAFLSFYRDWRVFVPATVVVATDHILRGLFWPESVFGVITAAPWRAFEHAGWVLFENVFLIWGCRTSVGELREMAVAQSELEASKQSIELEVQQRTSELAARTADLASERRLIETIMHSVADGIIAADEDGNYLCFNKGAEEILGVKALYDLSPHDWTREYGMFEPDGRTPVATDDLPLYRAMQGETVSNRELIIRRGATEKVVSVNATPLVSESHRGGIACFRDVTAQSQLQSQLADAQKLESIGQLAAGIAHEINTPMQYVSDNVEFLSECSVKLFEVVDIYRSNLHETNPPRPWQERIREVEAAHERCRFDHIRQQVPLAIEETKEGAQRVIEIVRAMKQLSHPGTDAKVSTNINEAIRSTITVTKNRWKYAADVDLFLCEDLPDVKTLTAEINQVLLNIVVNAADAIVEKYGENGSKGKIVIRTRGAVDHVEIEIQDDGCGMPEEVRRKIFDPFFTTKEVGKGTGQGLAISYNVIVKHHGGSLDVATEPGRGTTFLISLPTHPLEPSTLSPTEEASLANEEAADNALIV